MPFKAVFALLAVPVLLFSGCQANNQSVSNSTVPNGNGIAAVHESPGKEYPVKIVAGQESYPAAKGNVLSIPIKATGATSDYPLLGLKLTLSGVPAGLQNPKFAVAKDVANQTVRQLDNGKVVVLLYGMRVKKDQELGTLSFDVKEDVQDASIKVFYDKTAGSQMVSELSGTDGTNPGAYVTYPIEEKDLFMIKAQ